MDADLPSPGSQPRPSPSSTTTANAKPARHGARWAAHARGRRQVAYFFLAAGFLAAAFFGAAFLAAGFFGAAFLAAGFLAICERDSGRL